MWAKCLPRDTVQPMEAALRNFNSNEIICIHRKLRSYVPGKVSSESGLTIYWTIVALLISAMLTIGTHLGLSHFFLSLPMNLVPFESKLIDYALYTQPHAPSPPLFFLARLHFSAEELLLYPRRRRRRPHAKC